MRRLFAIVVLGAALSGCGFFEKDETGKSPVDYGTATFFEKLQHAQSLQDLGVAFIAGIGAAWAAKKGQKALAKPAPATPPPST